MAIERDIFYRIRRKGQVLAYRLTNPELMSKVYFRYLLGYRLNINNPCTLNEKLQWLKLYHWPNNSKAIQCADKYAVRTYVEGLGMGKLLNELLYVWDHENEIEWETLPHQFVLKCNHGCGYNIICRNKSDLDEQHVKKILHRWMKEDFSEFNAEPHYAKISRRIICEKYLGDNVINYNIYCFNGKATFLSVADGLGDGVEERLTYYNIDGTKASFKNKNYPTSEMTLSPLLKEMITTAESLSKEFVMTRVDLFDIDGKIVLSEMTFSPGGALIPFEPDTADRLLGKELDISEVMAAYGET